MSLTHSFHLKGVSSEPLFIFNCPILEYSDIGFKTKAKYRIVLNLIYLTLKLNPLNTILCTFEVDITYREEPEGLCTLYSAAVQYFLITFPDQILFIFHCQQRLNGTDRKTSSHLF